jgi:hypothetical protein
VNPELSNAFWKNIKSEVLKAYNTDHEQIVCKPELNLALSGYDASFYHEDRLLFTVNSASSTAEEAVQYALNMLGINTP